MKMRALVFMMLPMCTVASLMSIRKLMGWMGKGMDPTTPVSTTPPPEAICVNCVHFLLDAEENPSFGRCRAFPRQNASLKRALTEYRVTGVMPETDDEFYFCRTARELETMCGSNGTRFKPIPMGQDE